MYDNIVIIGNKNYKNLKLNNILDSFNNNIRFNFGLPNNNNGTKFDNIVLNNHVFEYAKKSLEEKINKYCEFFSISEQHISNFHNNLNKYKIIIKQTNDWKHFNIFLNNINCPYNFTHLPRVGYIKLMNFIINKKRVFVYGFSIENIYDEHLYVKNLKYGNQNEDHIKRTGHNWDTEIKILYWLHNNNFIDATLCFLVDTEIPTINCKFIKPTVEIITTILKYYPTCILKDYLNNNYNTHEYFTNISFDNNDCIIKL